MRISLNIPEHAVLIPQFSSKVSIGDPLYSISSEKVISIQVAKILNINPQDIFHFIKVSIHDEISKSSVLAEKKGIFGMKKIRSHVSGKVIRISHDDGTIDIESREENLDTQNKKTLQSFFNGIIIERKKNIYIVEIDKAKEIKIPELEKDFGGCMLSINSESEWFSLNEELVENSIIVFEKIPKSQAAKCEALGAIGFIIQTGNDVFEKPHIKITDINTFNKIKDHKGFILLSSHDRKALLY